MTAVLSITGPPGIGQTTSIGSTATQPQRPAAEEFKVWKVPNIPEGAECYFSPDGVPGERGRVYTFHFFRFDLY